MRLSRWVTPQNLKELNLGLMIKGAQSVGGAELKKRTRERAKMIREPLLQELLDEVPDVTRAEARGAWSHWMALVTMRQPFFDANHRTGLAAFNIATTKEWGFEYALATTDLEALMKGSRALVKRAHKPSDKEPRATSIADLRSAKHPARAFYASFENKLEERPL